MEERIAALNAAKDFVAPIVEQHGLEKMTSTQGLGITSSVSYSVVEQHLGHILDVADWLLGERH